QFAYPGVTADDTRFVLTVQGGVGVNVQSENQEAAKLFLEFWSLPEEGKVFTDASTLISANEASTGELSGTYTGLSPLFTGGKVIPDPTASWPNTSFKTNAGSSIQGLFTGQKTVDQVLADLDTYFEAE
ncbi:MAG: hypothetical protein LBL63_00630, partial [Clostridiales Family XIII bacterium]|nr:hypothetical protein [Clostridiales Family XIII bacterium]